jgi:hypothetical protein
VAKDPEERIVDALPGALGRRVERVPEHRTLVEPQRSDVLAECCDLVTSRSFLSISSTVPISPMESSVKRENRACMSTTPFIDCSIKSNNCKPVSCHCNSHGVRL